MGSPTIRDVARVAGVGIGTVSRVINNSPQVSTTTREKVLAAIQQLDFRPNKFARDLSLGTRHRNIGVILPFLTYQSFVERLRGVQAAISLSDNVYNLILYNVSAPDRFTEQLLAIVEQRLVDGLLIISLNVTEDHQRILENAGLVMRSIFDRQLPGVIAQNNVEGGRLATEYLIRLGHKRIAYIGDIFPNPYNFPTSEDRYSGYQRALSLHNIPLDPDYVRFGEHNRDIARALTLELLRLPAPPTAIFAMSDIQAFGCLSAIRDSHLHVPQDISVIGFDDLEISQEIGLTTVRQHLEISGQVAMEAILAQLQGLRLPSLQLPPMEVIVRGTTGEPHG